MFSKIPLHFQPYRGSIYDYVALTITSNELMNSAGVRNVTLRKSPLNNYNNRMEVIENHNNINHRRYLYYCAHVRKVLIQIQDNFFRFLITEHKNASLCTILPPYYVLTKCHNGNDIIRLTNCIHLFEQSIILIIIGNLKRGQPLQEAFVSESLQLSALYRCEGRIKMNYKVQSTI